MLVNLISEIDLANSEINKSMLYNRIKAFLSLDSSLTREFTLDNLKKIKISSKIVCNFYYYPRCNAFQFYSNL